MTTEFSKMDEESQNDVINTVIEQAITAADDDETTAKLLSAANVLIDAQTDDA